MSRSTADSAPSATLPTPKERRRLREALALSEEQVAEALGVTRATVRSWETGRSSPRGRKREAYARLLGADGAETLLPPEPTAPPWPEPRPQGPEARPQPEAPAAAQARPAAAPARPRGLRRGQRAAQGRREAGREAAPGPGPGAGHRARARAQRPRSRRSG
ncbi:helix-turn-helix transcriptional regulator [Streptomyces diastatochromogenes]|nr:helix-turn-helix transcriptional regulator [Streptomyces diastatochromogenes]